MNENIKVVLAHPDKQHSFQTAKALTEAGILHKYITTVYDRPFSLTRLFTKLCRGTFKKKLQTHRSAELADSQIKQYTEFLSLMLFLLVRIDKSKKIYSKLKIYRDKIFNKKVARYCIKNKVTAVVSFDVVSAQLYDYLGESNIIKVLDMSAPQYSYMCSLFEAEIKKHPTSALVGTLSTPLVNYWRKQSEQEIKSADAFLVASDFTKATLVKSGADEAKIYKCVYGINHSFFNSLERPAKNGTALKCVYVGNITEQKGFRYLLDAIKRIKNEGFNISFTMIGAYNPGDPLIAEASSLCEFTGHILPAQLKEHLLTSDVMVFPSLCDGFGFSVLEAMACGVVPICSRNAGVSDTINHNENGFLIDAADADAIYQKLKDLAIAQDTLPDLSVLASQATQNLTWNNYYSAISNAFIKITNEGKWSNE